MTVFALETYPNSAAIPITLAALASTTASPPVGRESAEVDNSVNRYLDALLDGVIVAGTTPTAGEIRVWAYGTAHDGSNFRRPAGATGADAGLTPAAYFGAVWRLLLVIPTITTSDLAYSFSGISIANAFGGILPKRWGLFVHHSMVAALNAAGHELRYTGIKQSSA